MNWIKLLLFTVATSFVTYAQEKKEVDTLEIDNLLDELFFNDQQFVQDFLNAINQYDFLYVNATYNSNTFFAGRDTGIDQLNFIPQVSYFSSSGFNVSISSAYYAKQQFNWDFVSLTAGYSNTIGKSKNAHYNIGYSRYFYSDGWNDLNNSLDVLFGLRNDKRNFGAIANVSYLFGSEQSVQITTRIYGDLTLSRSAKNMFRFRPQLSFLIAEHTVYRELPPPPGRLLPIIRSTQDFTVLNTQLYLPISLSSKAFDVEVGYNINFPSPITNEKSLSTTGYFTMSLGYLIDFTN